MLNSFWQVHKNTLFDKYIAFFGGGVVSIMLNTGNTKEIGARKCPISVVEAYIKANYHRTL